VYNTQPNRRGLKKLAEDPADTDVDFNAEMDRILETFRITELLKRNTKTKGLLGKELKTFLALVEGFKQAVIEDIVQVKKDGAEVRMRRAGYLRYTNMSSYRIVEDRYATKDWKTGEKFQSSGSDSSGIVTPTEEIASPIRFVPDLFYPLVCCLPEGTQVAPPASEWQLRMSILTDCSIATNKRISRRDHVIPLMLPTEGIWKAFTSVSMVTMDFTETS
jgi:hypothetical protein